MRFLIYDPKQKQMANQLMKTKKFLGGISQRLSHIFLKYLTGPMVPT